MHEPLPLTNKERMRGGHRQIIHDLGVLAQHDALNHPPGSSGRANVVAQPQGVRRDPAALPREEGMLGGRGDWLAVDRQTRLSKNSSPFSVVR